MSDQRTIEDIIQLAFVQFAEKDPNEEITTYEMNLGYQLLTDTLSSMSGKGLFIPYLTTVSFNLVPSYSRYIFTNTIQPIGPPGTDVFVASNPILDLYYCNYLFGSINYPVKIVSQAQFFQNVRIEKAQQLPSICTIHQELNQSILTLYPIPNIEVTMTVRGKAKLEVINQFVNITEVPTYYFKFLRYALGRELKTVYGRSEFSASDAKEYQDLYRLITSNSTWDCSVVPDGVLNSKYPFYPYAVNGSVIV